MNPKTSQVLKIIRTISLVLLVLILVYFFYFNKNNNLSVLKKIGKEILMPGPLTSNKEKTIKEVLSDDEIIKITNEYRHKNNKNDLGENELLNKAARERVDDMFEKQYFAHVSPEGKDVSDTLNNVHYYYVVAGENLALGYFSDSRDLVDAWMASPGHRENILSSKFREIGVAHKLGMFKGKKQYIAVQVFATSTIDCPLPSESLKQEIDNKEKEIESIENNLNSLQTEINSLKAQREALYNEINTLLNEGKSQIAQGNNLISRGNQVYSQTGDKTTANQYWSQGEALQEQGQSKIDEANAKNTTLQSLQSQLQQKINYYNFLITQVNSNQTTLKNLTSDYNKQVEAFNKCL